MSDRLEHLRQEYNLLYEALAEMPEPFQAEVMEQWIRQKGREVLASVSAEQSPPPEMTALADLLAEPDEEPIYRIQGLWPQGGNVVVSAQYKAGKTTLVGNVVRCLADGEPFLADGYPFVGPDGQAFNVEGLREGETVFVADLELPRRTLRRWLSDQKIGHPERVRIGSFRGRGAAFDILDGPRRQAWAELLASQGVKVLIVDPLAALLSCHSRDEDSNTDVGPVLDAIGSMAYDAGVSEIMIVHHMGHVGERSRGASRLRDWPDAEWRLVREGNGTAEPPPDAARFLIAEGRDVALGETRLAYNENTRRLSIAGGNRAAHEATRLHPVVLDVIERLPGATTRTVEEEVTAQGVAQAKARSALQAVVRAGKVHRCPGRHGARHHVLSDDCGFPDDCPAARKAAGLEAE